jgi:gliding motility-associated-like protein
MKKFHNYLILFLLVSVFGSGFAQTLEGRFWYFGNQAGLDFNATSPVAITNGAMSAFEGCATISDVNGNLQFYTNGSIVWDRTHTPMPSGSGLNGDGAATQTAIIVPKPATPGTYYIFTVDTNGGPRGLCYSEVDMSLNGGNGDITVKNVTLTTPVTEKLTAVRHANGIDAFVIVHGWNNNDFLTFPITSAGVSLTPITSTVGVVHGGNFTNSHGYLKASSDAQRIACAIRGLKVCEIFDFNNITGQISNPISINFTPQIYGVEFSPDSKYLYIGTTTNPGEIFQYDVKAGSNAAVIASGQSIGTIPGFIGGLQLGINGKIYVCQFQSTSLASIDQPKLLGAAAGFNPNTLFLGGKLGQYGLPNFLQSFFIVADFTYADTCSRTPTNFTTVFPSPDSVRWDFGDPASGIFNVSNQINPQHTFNAGGSYTVTAVVWLGLLSDTVRYTLQIIETPAPDLGSDFTSCDGTTITLDPGPFPGLPFLWQNNTTNPTFAATSSGTFWVRIDNQGCIGIDTVNGVFNPTPVVDLGLTINACDGDTIVLDAENPNATFIWQNGTTNQTLPVTVSGLYSVTVTENNCSATDDVNVIFSISPTVAFGPDTTLCKGFPIFLDATNPSATYLWQDGSVDQFLLAEDPGIYTVIVTINNCTATDTIILDQQDYPVLTFGEDTILCAGQDFKLSAYNYGAVYTWQDGSNDSIYEPRVTGLYFVDVVNQCGSTNDSILLTFNICNCLVYVPKAFTPNSDTKNEIFNYKANCTDFKARLDIYTRFGQLIFSTQNPDIGWDGTYEGKDAPEGVYTYVLKYSGYDNGRFLEDVDRSTFLLFR